VGSWTESAIPRGSNEAAREDREKGVAMRCWNCSGEMKLAHGDRGFDFWKCPKCGATNNCGQLPEVKSKLARSDKAAWKSYERRGRYYGC